MKPVGKAVFQVSAGYEQVARSVATHLLAPGALVLVSLSALFATDTICKPKTALVIIRDADVQKEST